MLSCLQILLASLIGTLAVLEVSASLWWRPHFVLESGWLHACCAILLLRDLLGSANELSRGRVAIPIRIGYGLLLIAALRCGLWLISDVANPISTTTQYFSILPWCYGCLAVGLYILSNTLSTADGRDTESPSQSDWHDLCLLVREQYWAAMFVVAGCAVGQSYLPAFKMLLLGYGIAVVSEELLRLVLEVLTSNHYLYALHHRSYLRQLLWCASDHDEVKIATMAVCRKMAYVTVALMLVGWFSSGIVIVRPAEIAIHYHLGRLTSEPLRPGLHVTWPYPLCRVKHLPVKRLFQLTTGYEGHAGLLSSTPFLWTKPHGNQEFPIIIGDGTEAVAVNAVVQYKIGESTEKLHEYVISTTSPELMLKTLAQRVLTTETRSCPLENLLGKTDSLWQRRLHAALQEECQLQSLGLEVLSFQVLSVHPPLEAASAYLEVVNARNEAEQQIAEFRGMADAEVHRCEMMARTRVADAQATASKRLAAVTEELTVCDALESAHRYSGRVVEQRLWSEILADSLEGKPLTLIDHRLPPETQLWLEDNASKSP